MKSQLVCHGPNTATKVERGRYTTAGPGKQNFTELAIGTALRSGAPARAKNATTCITSLHVAGENNIGRF